MIKKLIASVLAAAFMNFMIASEFASADSYGLTGEDRVTISLVLVGVVVIAGLVYLGVKSMEPKPRKPEEKTPGERNSEDTNPGIENLQPKSENDSLEFMRTAKSEEPPVTPSGELVILQW